MLGNVYGAPCARVHTTCGGSAANGRRGAGVFAEKAFILRNAFRAPHLQDSISRLFAIQIRAAQVSLVLAAFVGAPAAHWPGRVTPLVAPQPSMVR